MSGDKDSKQDLAFTPGGPRPRSKVHLVAAHQGPADDLVIAPGGPKRRRDVHLIKPRQQALFGAKSAIPLRRRDEPGPPDMANWITCAWWTNTTGGPIESFVTTWTVPPDPATKGSQLLYLFNGLEPADGQMILQPVLQWGDSGFDEDNVNRTGQFWTVASWLVGWPRQFGSSHPPHPRQSGRRPHWKNELGQPGFGGIHVHLRIPGARHGAPDTAHVRTGRMLRAVKSRLGTRDEYSTIFSRTRPTCGTSIEDASQDPVDNSTANEQPL